MATLGRWSGGTIGSLQPTTSWGAPNALFPTETRNDSSTYSWTSSTSTVTLPSSGLADGYLLRATVEFNCTNTNARHNIQGRFQQTGGTGNFVTAQVGGFSRETTEDRSFLQVWAIVDGPSASATFQFQWKEEADQPQATDGTVNSEFDIVPLYYADIGMYTGNATSTYGGTTANTVTLGTTVVEGTNITRSGSTVTVTGNSKRYLIFGGMYGEDWSGGTRTQRLVRLAYDGTGDTNTQTYFYLRNGNNDESGGMVSDILETVTADVGITLQCYRGDGVSAGQGGANSDGGTTRTNGADSLVVIELNDNADVFRSHDQTGAESISTSASPVDLSAVRTLDFNDSASFTKASNTQLNVVQTCDVLCWANIWATRNWVATTDDSLRLSSRAHITLALTEDDATRHGNYLRGEQGAADTFSWGASPGGFIGVTAGQDLGVSVQTIDAATEGADSANNNDETRPNGVGFWGINLDTLQASGGVDHTIEPPVETLTITENNPTATRDYSAFPPTATLTITEQTPTTTRDFTVIPPTETLTITEQTPTTVVPEILTREQKASTISYLRPYVLVGIEPDGSLDASERAFTNTLHSYSGNFDEGVTGDFTITPPTAALTLTEQTPTVVRDYSAFPPTETLTISEQAPTVVRDYTAFPPTETLTLTEQTPVVIRDYSALPPTEALTLTEQTPTVVRDYSAFPPTETLTITEQTPVVIQDYTVTPPTASLTISEQTPLVTRDYSAFPPTETLTINEQTPNISRQSSVFPPTAELTLTEQNPVVTRDYSSFPPTETLTITEQTPVITQDHTVVPPTETLTLTAFAPSTGGDQTVIPPTATLTLAEQIPVVTRDYSAFPPSESLTLTEFAPVITQDHTAFPPTVSLTLTEFAPTIAEDITEAPPTVSLTINEQTPVVTRDYTAFPATAALTLTEQTPTVAQDHTVNPLTEIITITENAPTINLSGGDIDVEVPGESLTITANDPAGAFVTAPIPQPGAGGGGGSSPYYWPGGTGTAVPDQEKRESIALELEDLYRSIHARAEQDDQLVVEVSALVADHADSDSDLPSPEEIEWERFVEDGRAKILDLQLKMKSIQDRLGIVRRQIADEEAAVILLLLS